MNQQTKKVVPESFEYLGKVFTPIPTNEKYNFIELSAKLWGGGENLKPLDCINKDFTHEDFYKIAKQHGCGKIDVFELDGEKVIPSSRLMYYGEPTWYAVQKQEEEQRKKERTKGEWIYSKYSPYDFGVYSQTGNGNDIALVREYGEAGEANAAFICKAVNNYDSLLSALKNCVVVMDRVREILKGRDNGNWGMLDTEQAKEAIRQL